jgi:chromosomal replication initiator protein
MDDASLAVDISMDWPDMVLEPTSLSMEPRMVRSSIRKHGLLGVDAVIAFVCSELRVSREDVVSRWRFKNLVAARFAAMYVARHVTGASYPELGRAFGGRDHTSVMHAVRKVEALCAGDARFRETMNNLIEEASNRA